MVIAENLLLTMGDEEGMWGKPSQFFISDKPIDLTPIDGAEFSCEVEPTRLGTLADMVAQKSVDNARFKANDFDHTITMEVTISPKQMRNLRKMLRVPKLPRKLKKRVKKTCFIKYPKRIDRYSLNFVFALNYPHRMGRVKMVAVKWPYVEDELEKLEKAYQQTKTNE